MQEGSFELAGGRRESERRGRYGAMQRMMVVVVIVWRGWRIEGTRGVGFFSLAISFFGIFHISVCLAPNLAEGGLVLS